MIMPKFTEDQQKAIDLEGSNILVSAGAGSLKKNKRRDTYK